MATFTYHSWHHNGEFSEDELRASLDGLDNILKKLKQEPREYEYEHDGTVFFTASVLVSGYEDDDVDCIIAHYMVDDDYDDDDDYDNWLAAMFKKLALKTEPDFYTLEG